MKYEFDLIKKVLVLSEILDKDIKRKSYNDFEFSKLYRKEDVSVKVILHFTSENINMLSFRSSDGRVKMSQEDNGLSIVFDFSNHELLRYKEDDIEMYQIRGIIPGKCRYLASMRFENEIAEEIKQRNREHAKLLTIRQQNAEKKCSGFPKTQDINGAKKKRKNRRRNKGHQLTAWYMDHPYRGGACNPK